MKRQEAVDAAIKQCIEQGILIEYLNSNASEVLNMLLNEWNWDDAKTVWQREAKETSDREWRPIVEQKDAEIANLKMQLEMKKEN